MIKFTLYITGATARSELAMANLWLVCEQLGEAYNLVVVDVLEQPQCAEIEHIIATPTLVKEEPLPIRRIIGDLTDTQRVLQELGMKNSERQLKIAA